MAAQDWHVDLSGRVALVTGGRRGLGKAMALGLGGAGAHVAVVSASDEHDELSKAFEAVGAELTYVQADLADRPQRDGLIDRVVAQTGRLDILVNNAGIIHREPAVDFAVDKWDAMLNLMLTAVFELSQQAGRIMIAQGGGKIINIASLMSFQGGWTVPAYAAVKSGVAGLTRALANEWAAKNVNVNAIAPGYFATDLTEALRNDPVREPKIRQRIPADRWGMPDELVGPLLFLASDASRYVHGHVLAVDGGWLSR